MRPLGWNEEILGEATWALLRSLSPSPAFVTGEAALAGFWFHHRGISRVELAVRTEAELQEVASAIPGERLSEVPGFIRFRELDLMLDHDHVVDLDKPEEDGVRADSLGDLAADRILRLMGAPDPNLVVDLFFLARARVDLARAARDAAAKDLGLTPSALALVLSRSRPTVLPPGLIRPVDLGQLQEFVEGEIVRFGMQAYG